MLTIRRGSHLTRAILQLHTKRCHSSHYLMIGHFLIQNDLISLPITDALSVKTDVIFKFTSAD